MALFKVRLEINCQAGERCLLVAQGQRPPLRALDPALTWRERVGSFTAKVLGLAPQELSLREARTIIDGEAELRLYVDCRVERAATPLDERLEWSGGEDGAQKQAPPPGEKPVAAPEGHAGALDPAETVVLHTDGGSRGNPGPAGIGAVLSQSASGYSEELAAHIGRTTNNVAEYTALVEGLRLARSRGARHVEHLTDSELMVRQLEGRYRVKSPELKPLFDEVRALIAGFDSFSTSHVRREFNRQADSLVNRALDEAARTGNQ